MHSHRKIKAKILLASNQVSEEKVPKCTIENYPASSEPGLPAGSLAEKECALGPLISFSSPYNVCDYAADKISQKSLEQQNHRPMANLGAKNKLRFSSFKEDLAENMVPHGHTAVTFCHQSESYS